LATELKLAAFYAKNDWVADAEALPKPAWFNQRKGKMMDTTTLLILIVVLLLLFGGGGYFWNRGRGA
jgi:hypothetical protein